MSQVRKKLLAIAVMVVAIAFLAGLAVYSVRLSVGFMAQPKDYTDLVPPETDGPDGATVGNRRHRAPSEMPEPINLASTNGSDGFAASLVTLSADQSNKLGEARIVLPAAEAAPAVVQLPRAAASPISLPAATENKTQSSAKVATIPFSPSVPFRTVGVANMSGVGDQPLSKTGGDARNVGDAIPAAVQIGSSPAISREVPHETTLGFGDAAALALIQFSPSSTSPVDVNAAAPRPIMQIEQEHGVGSDEPAAVQLAARRAIQPSLPAATILTAGKTDVPTAIRFGTPSTAAVTIVAARQASSAPQAITTAVTTSNYNTPSATLEFASTASTSVAGVAILPAGITRPPLEIAREQAERQAGNNEKSNITIETGFECSQHMNVRQISPTHFALEVSSPCWFMFRVHGVAGKTVRFDMVNPGVGLRYWSTLNPVYTYATGVDDEATYAVDEKAQAAAASQKEARAWNGPLLPSTVGQKWHFISNAWEEEPHQFSFVQWFEKDDAIVAMRVPVAPSYWRQRLQEFGHLPCASLIQVGTSANDMPLLLLKVGVGDTGSEQSKPCVLIYAGEHADEPDGIVAVLGAADFLLSDCPEARHIRDGYTFLFLPMMDPAATVTATHERIIYGFMTNLRRPETIAYSNWFRQWVNDGKRLDLVFDLHNMQSNEGPNLCCPVLEGIGVYGRLSESLHQIILKNCFETGFTVNPKPWNRGWSPDRLGGWLGRRYGPLTIAYELNSQAPDHHLNLQQLQGAGRIFVRASTELFSSPDGRTLLANADTRRQERLARWTKNGAGASNTDAIDAEATVSNGVGLRKTSADNLLVERWVP